MSKVQNFLKPSAFNSCYDTEDSKVKEAASLRSQSEQLLEYAKQAVEMAIEQREDVALAWLKEKIGEQNDE